MPTEAINIPRPSAEDLLNMYKLMLRMERNDFAIRKQIRLGKITSPYYSARGQEAIPAAIATQLTDHDRICTIYRGMHDMIAKGMPLRPLWAEICGRVDGTCKGKGGPMHLTHPETGIMVTTGVVGSSMPIANGFAWASLLEKSGSVTIASFGDGASNIGAFHESLNLASLWKLPVVFVCQNNGYAEHTRFSNGTSVDFISKRAVGYAMPGYTVDGNDPDEMYGYAAIAVRRAREGEGPTLLECKTFRYYGHLVGDDGSYMLPGERDAAMAKDPLPKLRARVLADGLITQDQHDDLVASIEAEIEDAVQFALNSPFPPLDELRRDVFATEIPA